MSPPTTVDGIEFVLGKGVAHVIVVTPVEHSSGVLPELQPSLLGEWPVDCLIHVNNTQNSRHAHIRLSQESRVTH